MANGWGGKRDGAGRPAGSKNKRTSAVKAKLEEMDADPIKVLVDVMRSSDERLQIDAAKALLPYAYPRLTSQDLNVTGEQIQNIILEIATPDDGSGD